MIPISLKSAGILMAILAFSLPGRAEAAAVRFNMNGYYGYVEATQMNGKVTLHGRLESGWPCASVLVTAQIADSEGHNLDVEATVAPYDGGSKLIESKTYGKISNDTEWSVKTLTVECTTK